MEKERLDILRTLAAGIAVTDVADGHTPRKLGQLLFIEHLAYKSVSFNPVELTCRSYSNDTASLLASMLESVQAVICQAGGIIDTIYSKNATFVVELVIPVTVTLTHFRFILYPQLCRG